ncbi:MAG: GNAT family N-acetyltransferase [Alphaproteobacteria bacterium]|nr:GNAT family N-acetyltransferase [Alphaproteobacteria bacterium]
MEFSLAGDTGRTYSIRTELVTQFDPALVKTVIDIDLMTFSEPTWSRTTAGLVLRYGMTWLLRADDWVIGTCHCIRSWERPHEAVLFSMAIRPGWRGRGLGTRFLQGVLDGLVGQGMRSVVLEVSANNRAGVRIYEERFGFCRLGEVEASPPGGRSAMLRMRKVLKDGPLAEITEFPT